MALDGAYLHHIKNELNQKLSGGRVTKVYQPSRDELVLVIKTRESTNKLLISARPDTARIHISQSEFENPKQPPMLCMLLRKRLQGGIFSHVYQNELERVLKIEFECTDELRDKVKLCLVCEIMGRHSNIILTDEEGKIIDALKRVDASMSSVRIVFPGIKYQNPPSQDKLSILETDSLSVINKIKEKEQRISKALMGILQGISPIVSRELEHIAGRGEEIDSLNMYSEKRLKEALDDLRETIKNHSGQPYIVINEKPIDFSFMEIKQYSDAAVVSKEESFSSLLDRYYLERDQIERMKVKSSDILKILVNRNERISRKINNQIIELEETENKEEKRIMAEILSSNVASVERGAESVSLLNYYDENMGNIEIKLDPALSPQQNVQKYYKDYKKAKTAQIKLKEQILLSEEELKYIDSIFYSLSEAKSSDDLDEIRQEMMESGYISKKKGKDKPVNSKILKIDIEDDFFALAGKNNKQNDKLTLKDSNKNDYWFHTKNIPGSHVILVTNGREPSEKALYEAALIAARNSKAKASSLVPVDYTKVRYVSKPNGAKPGMVIYKNEKTIYVNP